MPTSHEETEPGWLSACPGHIPQSCCFQSWDFVLLFPDCPLTRTGVCFPQPSSVSLCPVILLLPASYTHVGMAYHQMSRTPRPTRRAFPSLWTLSPHSAGLSTASPNDLSVLLVRGGEPSRAGLPVALLP